MVIVSISEDMRVKARALGQLRFTESRRQHLALGHHGLTVGQERRIDMIGALGEFVAAAALHFPEPTTVNTFKAPDLGADIQVRATTHPDGGLLVRPSDPDDDLFLLVVLSLPDEGRVVGWLKGLDCKQPAWFERKGLNRPPAWFVPQGKLHSPHQLLGPVECPTEDEISWGF